MPNTPIDLGIDAFSPKEMAEKVETAGVTKAHLGFTGTKAELEARPDIRAKYLEV